MNGKKVMVLGMARSGVAAAKLLSSLGAQVRISDQKTKEQLAAAAAPIVNARRWFLSELSDYAARQYADISENPAEPFAIRYTGPLAETDTPYRDMLAGLAATRKDDLQRLFTHFGPHRDDVAMTLYGKELRAFGSQGQLRTAVLSLKLGEISLIENEMGELPTLLLDDVFSELDIRRRSALLRATEHLQTFLSCTDKQDAAGAHAEQFLRVCQNENGEAAVQEG
jgi:DNA replication and repair protein RecF